MRASRLLAAVRRADLMAGRLGAMLRLLLGTCAVILVGAALGRGFEPGGTRTVTITSPAGQTAPAQSEGVMGMLGSTLRAISRAGLSEADRGETALLVENPNVVSDEDLGEAPDDESMEPENDDAPARLIEPAPAVLAVAGPPPLVAATEDTAVGEDDDGGDDPEPEAVAMSEAPSVTSEPSPPLEAPPPAGAGAAVAPVVLATPVPRVAPPAPTVAPTLNKPTRPAPTPKPTAARLPTRAPTPGPTPRPVTARDR